MGSSNRDYSKMMPRARTLYKYLSEDWEAFCEVCNLRWEDIEPNLMTGRLTKTDVLGSGYFGIVLKTAHKKLVVKVTSDKDEGFFSELILSNPKLRESPGLPYLFDVFQIEEWDAFVILREDMHYGVGEIPESSPILRSLPILDSYGESLSRIDGKVLKLLDGLQAVDPEMSKRDVNLALSEARGLIQVEILKTLTKLPQPKKSSNYYSIMEVIREALNTYGIALWDLHRLNLGKHKHDMSDLVKGLPPRKKGTIALLDVGGNIGTPAIESLIDSVNLS